MPPASQTGNDLNMSNNMAKRDYFERRGLRLSYLDSAPADTQRPAVLLLHGFPDTAAMWGPQITALHAAGYRCIAPDTVGCGESQMADRMRDYNCELIAADHVALLDHLGIERAHVVGHDWGSAIAWLVAGHYPLRCTSLIAMSVGHPTSYALGGVRQKLKGWYVFFFQLGGLSDRLLARPGAFGLRRVFRSHPHMDEVMARLSEPGRLTAAVRIYRASLPSILFKRQPNVAAPTLGILSRADRFLTEDQMASSGRRVDAEWRYEMLDGGHWMPIEQPERINALILDHIRAHAAERGAEPNAV
jgi:pimeloyl-ACP methyl ester carboxylesterase